VQWHLDVLCKTLSRETSFEAYGHVQHLHVGRAYRVALQIDAAAKLLPFEEAFYGVPVTEVDAVLNRRRPVSRGRVHLTEILARLSSLFSPAGGSDRAGARILA